MLLAVSATSLVTYLSRYTRKMWTIQTLRRCLHKLRLPESGEIRTKLRELRKLRYVQDQNTTERNWAKLGDLYKNWESGGWFPSNLYYQLRLLCQASRCFSDLQLVVVVRANALPRLQYEINDFDWTTPPSITSHPLCQNCAQSGHRPSSLPFALMLFFYFLFPLPLSNWHSQQPVTHFCNVRIHVYFYYL
jgi:hypothetical protein